MPEVKLTCIVVDDEPMALEMLTDYVKFTPFLELTGAFHQPLEALTFIQSHKTDLLFTDISMPGLSGIQFIKSLPVKPLCILTTAYSEYALEGYDLDVVDYLLKPIEFERFIKAATRALELFRLKHTTKEAAVPTPEKQQVILIKSGTKMHQIKLSDIRWVEASGNYVTFHLVDKKIMSLTNIRDVEARLPEEEFTRTHRSFIVSRAHIETIEPHEVTIAGMGIPISKSYRKAVLSKLTNT